MDYIKPAIENALKWDYDNDFPMGFDLREDLRTALQEITKLIPTLAHREEQIKGLLEALQEIGINGFSNMDRDKARAALATYKEQTK